MRVEADILKALGEPMRMRLAALLAHEGEVCVCRLAAAIGEPDSKVSKHLSVLRTAGLAETRRKGTWIYYRLRDPRTLFETALWSALRVGLGHTLELEADRKRLTTVSCTLTPAPTAVQKATAVREEI